MTRLPSGTITGRTMYPRFLPSCRRMTRPTAWTISTLDVRGSMNRTASRAGTSTPSVRHLALVMTWHCPAGMSAFSSLRACARMLALVFPST